MPRLRAVRTKEEAEAVPQDQSISVIISDDDPPEKTGSIALRDMAGDTDHQTEAPSAVEAAPQPESPQVDEEKDGLKKRLQELERAEQAAQALAAQRQRQIEELQRQGQASANQNQLALWQANFDSVVSGLASFQAEANEAQQAWKVARNEGDLDKETAANDRWLTAKAKIVQYEDAKANLEARGEELKKAPVQQQPISVADQIEQRIAGYPEEAKTWLRARPQYLTDRRKNAQIGFLHEEALAAGHSAFTKPYFEWIETELGERQKPKVQQDEDEEEQVEETRRERSVVSAPVSRESPSLRDGRPTTRRITLSPEQREMARVSGVSEVEYAKQLLRLQQAKKDGLIQ